MYYTPDTQLQNPSLSDTIQTGNALPPMGTDIVSMLQAL